MSTEEGEVVEKRGEKAVVKIEGGLRCMTCAARGACKMLGDGARTIELPVPQDVQPGERIVIRYTSQSRILSALTIFLVPIAGLLGGFAAGMAAFGSQGAGVLGAFAGLALGFVLLRAIDRAMARRSTLLPEVVAHRTGSG